MKYEMPKKIYHYAVEAEYFEPKKHKVPLKTPIVFEVPTLKELNRRIDETYDSMQVMITRIRLATEEEIKLYKQGHYD